MSATAQPYGAGGESVYRRHMELAAGAYLELSLELADPIEVRELGDMLGSLANQYDDFVRAVAPEAENTARFYIKSIREGSIIIDFVATAIGVMDQALITRDFSKTVTSRFNRLRGPDGADNAKAMTKRELGQVADMLRPVAEDRDGKMVLAYREVTEKPDGERREVQVAVQTGEAARDLGTVMRATLAVKPDVRHERHEHVVMQFWQTNVGDPKTGKRSGHKVVIAAVTDAAKPVVYQSDLAEDRIKHEIAEAEDNIYRKGFLVTVIAEWHGEKLIVYRLAEVHGVFDLDEDEQPPPELPSA